MKPNHIIALAFIVSGLGAAPAPVVSPAVAADKVPPAGGPRSFEPTRPLGEPLRSAGSSEDDFSRLKTEAPRGPTEATAILWERVIRGLQDRETTVSESAQGHHESGRREMAGASREAADRALSEFGAALLEAPAWALPYRDIAGALEVLDRTEDAATSLELYLVAEPRAADWEEVRRKIRALRSGSPRTKPGADPRRGNK